MPTLSGAATRRTVVRGAAVATGAAGTAALAGSGRADAAERYAPRKYRNKKLKLLNARSRNLVTKFSYGITPAMAKEIKEQGGANKWFERQLDAGSVRDTAADRIFGWWPSLARGPEDLWLRNNNKTEFGWEVMADYQRWLLLRRMHTKRQVLEVMTEFWENHLNVPVSGDGVWTHRVPYGQTIRRHALGRFEDLLYATITHPAMLIYLDGAVSTARHPNENLGRELLELHTVGRGNYDEDDVKSSARILTGWHVDVWDTWAPSYETEDHWRGQVSVMSFSDPNASADGRDLTRRYLRFLARHPATAKRIARKLCVKFCTDNPPQSLVDTLAQVYLRHDTDIRPVLRALVGSATFQHAIGSKVRDPCEDVVATYRSLGVKIATPPKGGGASDSVVNAILWQTNDLGLEPVDWPQPNGSPTDNHSWSSPSRMVASMEVHWAMSGGWWPDKGVTYKKPVQWLPKGRKSKARLDVLVDHLCQQLLHRHSTPVLLRACCESVGYGPRTVVDKDHPIMRWELVRILTTLLDSPAHMTR